MSNRSASTIFRKVSHDQLALPQAEPPLAAGKKLSLFKEAISACVFSASLPLLLASACSGDPSAASLLSPDSPMPPMSPSSSMPPTTPPPTTTPPLAPQVADWVREARVGGFDADPSMAMDAVQKLLVERKSQNVSVLEVDSGLSENLTDDQFAAQVTFLNNVAKMAHGLGMHAVIYYPSLEVLTENGETLPHSMYKDHPDWIQKSITGQPNVFYGGKEHWVKPGAESAWMSPNTPYKDYFLNRIRKLAATELDGVWADVPIYLDTGVAWAGAEPAAAAAFQKWSLDHHLGGGSGFQVPTIVDWNSPAFRAWIRFRHENLADFTDSIRVAAQEVKPDFQVVIETFPIDNMDMTATGLDGSVRRSARNFIRVWEVDSDSNTNAMQWSTTEEFDNKIAMFKWTRAAESENPAWVFSYGNQELDAGLVMAAAVATGNSPFESKTPDMTVSVGSPFRTRWFGFIGDHVDALLKTPRRAQVGVWYSSPTRDFQDYAVGGQFGLYVTIKPPTPDSDWWANDPGDSALLKPHLGGWRGAAHALIQLGLPFKPILEQTSGAPRDELAGMSLVWLPSVAALSNDSVAALVEYVKGGGVLLATDRIPAQMDELGGARATNPLAEVLDFQPDPMTMQPRPTLKKVGAGFGIYRPDLSGAAVFGMVNNPTTAASQLKAIKDLMRQFVREDVSIDAPTGVFIDEARPTADTNYLYVVNYSGLKVPAVASPADITIHYRAPAGYQVVMAESASPDAAGQKGTLAISAEAGGLTRIALHVDQFALVTLKLAPAAPAQ